MDTNVGLSSVGSELDFLVYWLNSTKQGLWKARAEAQASGVVCQ